MLLARGRLEPLNDAGMPLGESGLAVLPLDYDTEPFWPEDDLIARLHLDWTEAPDEKGAARLAPRRARSGVSGARR